MISCSCGEWEPEAGDVIIINDPNDFVTLQTKRSRRCVSCGRKIRPGEDVIKMDRIKMSEHDIEVEIYGDDYDCGPPRAAKYHCEECGGLFLAIKERGYCFQWNGNMRELAKEVGAMDRGEYHDAI